MSSPDVKAAAAELCPTGVLRAGINLANFLLVTGKTADGDPVGVAPDVARAIADRLGATIKYVPYKSPADLADRAESNEWDIGLIGAEPQRAEKIAFTAAYCEIEATYLVPAGSPLTSLVDVDKAGRRIACMKGSAYGLWLERNIKQAELVWTDSIDSSHAKFLEGGCDALAGLKPRLIADAAKLPGSTIIPGRFMAVQQAIGTQRKNKAASTFLEAFVTQAKSTGLVASLIAKHGVKGLSVAE